MRMAVRSFGGIRWIMSSTLILGLLIGACGAGATSTRTATPTVATPVSTVLPTPSPTARATVGSETPQPTSAPATSPAEPGPSPTPTVTPIILSDGDRQIGEVEGITFAVGEGSVATFTVEEKLRFLPLPNDAVVRTDALSGEVYLDGRPSVIQIDLHQLNSDQSRRDQYIRRAMFPDHPTATFTVDDIGPMPQGFRDGEFVAGQVTGQLDVRGVQVPITFDLEGRDDGDLIFILARTRFVWADFGMTAPSIGRLVQVTDEVNVEILLALRPQSPS